MLLYLVILRGSTLSGWKENFVTKPSDFNSRVFGVRLDNLVDLDIDNPIMQKFLGGIICGASLEENQIH